MNFENPGPLLVCPRPVRLAPRDWLARATARPVADENEPSRDSPQPQSPSPKLSSPRSPLSSEAMDEFLSILKPSLPAFFPPSSPILRSYMPNAMPVFGHERSRSLRITRLENGKDTAEEDTDVLRSSTPSRASNRSDADDESAHTSHPSSSPNMMTMAADITGRWFRSAILSSPVSRTNGARNPFIKHAASRAFTPRPLTPLSPAAIPLPPTPDIAMEA
ncbi:hypothetical protein DL96DRAFT_1598528 [Flagelloscypha sp. PMI_526]|nr:hypothetical protein DL96DRAFT_1598528 [Flagelloscypha sp. PMI_526]